jgi:hypothetical protein
MRHQLNAGVKLSADDGPRPWLRGVEGYRHADLALVHTVGHGQSAMVDRSIPVVAKTRRIALSGTPSDAGLWNTTSHPRRG